VNILILEDSKERMVEFRKRLREHTIYHAETAREAVSFLRSKQIDVAFLDHDLGGEAFQTPGKDTGYGVAKWIENHLEFCPKQVVIHSLNAYASKMMQACIPGSQLVPFAWTKL